MKIATILNDHLCVMCIIHVAFSRKHLWFKTCKFIVSARQKSVFGLLTIRSCRRLELRDTSMNASSAHIPLLCLIASLLPWHVKSKGVRTARQLGEMVVTTACPSLRTVPYDARLDLSFVYLLEFEKDSTIDFAAFDRVLANAIAMELKSCDSRRQPLYAIELMPDSHAFVSEGKELGTIVISPKESRLTVSPLN